MNLLDFKITHFKTNSIQDFIDVWAGQYAYNSPDEFYEPLLRKDKFSKNDIVKLFTWKNGFDFYGVNEKKTSSVEQIIKQLALVNKLKKSFDLDIFKNSFQLGTIWKIFFLHAIDQSYPIFDQHVFRAHRYISTGVIEEISRNNKKKWTYYTDNYLPFFNELKLQVNDGRKIDKALWAFGKYLKTKAITFEFA